MNESNLTKAAWLTLETVSGQIYGHERALFRVKYSEEISEHMKEIDLKVLTPGLEHLIKLGTADYFNGIYDDVVTRNDKVVNTLFDKYKSLIDHSPLCLIHILFKSCLQAHFELDRSKLVDKGKLEYLENYAASVRFQLSDMFRYETLIGVRNFLNHTCTGEKILTPLPPGQKLFSYVEVPETPVAGSETLKSKNCSICGNESATKCGGCRVKRYCSAECQRKDWKEHKKECKKISHQ